MRRLACHLPTVLVSTAPNPADHARNSSPIPDAISRNETGLAGHPPNAISRPTSSGDRITTTPTQTSRRPGDVDKPNRRARPLPHRKCGSAETREREQQKE